MAERRVFTKRELFHKMSSSKNAAKVKLGLDYILAELNFRIDETDEDGLEKLAASLKSFVAYAEHKWDKANRTKDRFETQNKDWLDSAFILPSGLVRRMDIRHSSTVRKSGSSSGRPSLEFQEMSERSKRRHASTLKETERESEKLVMAGNMAARSEHKFDLVRILTEALKTPTRPTKMRRQLFGPTSNISKYSPDEALALLYDCGLSKNQYVQLRTGAKLKGADIYPSYDLVLASKKDALPDPHSLEISTNGDTAETRLQELVNHTSHRIVKLCGDVALELMTKINSKEIQLELIAIWGLDAATGQSIYAQKNAPDISSLLAVSMVPLRLVRGSDIVWINKTPQSYRYCRPIKLAYVKETADIINREVNNIKNQIERLVPVVFNLPNGGTVHVTCHFYLTMIDGKVLNHLTGTSSMQVCSICKATPIMFNKLENQQNGLFAPDPQNLQYGVSPLHSWIRFLECCLHIAYRLDFKKWQSKGAENQQKLKEKKKYVQDTLYAEIGILVDQVRGNGSGTSNTGNTARRAFSNYAKFAEILGLNEELVKNFYVILISLSCLLPVHPEKFGDFCNKTAQLYVKHYDWFYMPSSVHKILIHGSQILLQSVLPVGVMSEEAGESRHKFFKSDREFHSRKIGPKETMTDIYTRAMASSDPIISSFSLDRRLKQRKELILPIEVMEMLIIPEDEESRSDDVSEANYEEQDESSELHDIFTQLDQIILDSEECDN